MSSTEVIANGICVLITYESAKNYFSKNAARSKIFSPKIM